MSQFTHPALEDVPLAGMLHALSEPARLQIVARLAEERRRSDDGLSCSEAAGPDLARATMSNHFAILRAAGLVESRKAGVRVLNRLRQDEVERRFPGLLGAVLSAGAGSDHGSPVVA